MPMLMGLGSAAHNGRGFGEAVAFGEQGLGLGGEPGAHVIAERGAAGNHDLQAGELFGMNRVGTPECGEQGGDRRQDIGPGAGKQIQQRLHLEARQHDYRGAIAQGHVHANGHGKDVEERQHRHDLGGRVEQIGAPSVDLAHIGRNIGVGEQGALGQAGGAAGILLDGNIALGIDDDRIGGFAAGEQLVERGDVVAGGGAPEIGQVLALGNGIQHALGQRQGLGKMAHNKVLDVAARHERFGLVEDLLEIEGDHQLGAGIGHDVAELGHGIKRIAVDHGAAGPQHGIIGNGIERGVGQHQRDAAALADAKLVLQGAGEGNDAFGELAKAGGAAQEIERDGRGVLGAAGEHLFMDGPGFDGDVPANAFGIAGNPGAQGCRLGIDHIHHVFLLPGSGRAVALVRERRLLQSRGVNYPMALR
jgi:hypothetical protein